MLALGQGEGDRGRMEGQLKLQFFSPDLLKEANNSEAGLFLLQNPNLALVVEIFSFGGWGAGGCSFTCSVRNVQGRGVSVSGFDTP